MIRTFWVLGRVWSKTKLEGGQGPNHAGPYDDDKDLVFILKAMESH